ncbi:hypothetical protein [Catellatospora methionotrophica]|uniref:hypothetical protein n=1 Tax=Catellatospora methionotrophica TaxID=121620 RepID=UPI001F0D44AF|nr:hypothetical protein [Catellatospora methionotrophica]
MIEQRPVRMGGHLNVEAGCRRDRSAEGGRPFVDQPQQIRERENYAHPGFYHCAPAIGQRISHRRGGSPH